MEQNMTIFCSELEFRKFIILNSHRISQIIIFEDNLNKSIFFYCFAQKELLAATKERASNSFEKYKEKYLKLAANLKFYVVPYSKHHNVLKLKK